MNIIYELNRVYFTYPDSNISILEDISFKIKKGEKLAIIGPNGSGKTTLLKLLSGILIPEKGNIMLHEKKLESYSVREFAQLLGVMHQDTFFQAQFPLEYYVMLGRLPLKGLLEPFNINDKQATEKAMIQTGIEHLKNQTIDTLSGGEKKRAILSRILSKEPSILLLDEPFANLDILHKINLYQIISNLKSNKTLIAVIHDLNSLKFFNKFIFLKEGRLFAEILDYKNIKEDIIRALYSIPKKINLNDYIVL